MLIFFNCPCDYVRFYNTLDTALSAYQASIKQLDGDKRRTSRTPHLATGNSYF